MAKSETFVSRGIILAAGDGDRMGDLTKQYPKVLLPVNFSGDPLITFPIKAMAESGIQDIVIVVGYMAGKVKHELGDGSKYGVNLDYIFNQDYFSGNAISAWKARSWSTGEPVILCMGDHVIQTEIVRRLLSTNKLTDTLCVEYRPTFCHDVEEATKVSLYKDGCIQDIGKKLKSWDALDIGVFLLTEKFFKAIGELAELRGDNIEMSDVINFMVAKGHCFNTCDASNCSWMDIDTREDLELAQSKGY